MRLLAISGSLRAASSNTLLIEALGDLGVPGLEVEVYRGLGQLPHFNPDLDGDAIATVRALRQAVGQADGLILCSPEYAHGVAGVMKNALDWLVPSLEFPQTPVALLNTAPHAHHAQAHIRDTLAVMQARIVEEASVTVSLHGRSNVDEILADEALAATVRAALSTFTAAIAALPAKPTWT
jgi:NAD(P)H-dependent FMN reductase